jgi:hypothetical protein
VKVHTACILSCRITYYYSSFEGSPLIMYSQLHERATHVCLCWSSGGCCRHPPVVSQCYWYYSAVSSLCDMNLKFEFSIFESRKTLIDTDTAPPHPPSTISRTSTHHSAQSIQYLQYVATARTLVCTMSISRPRSYSVVTQIKALWL